MLIRVPCGILKQKVSECQPPPLVSSSRDSCGAGEDVSLDLGLDPRQTEVVVIGIHSVARDCRLAASPA